MKALTPTPLFLLLPPNLFHYTHLPKNPIKFEAPKPQKFTHVALLKAMDKQLTTLEYYNSENVSFYCLKSQILKLLSRWVRLLLGSFLSNNFIIVRLRNTEQRINVRPEEHLLKVRQYYTEQNLFVQYTITQQSVNFWDSLAEQILAYKFNLLSFGWTIRKSSLCPLQQYRYRVYIDYSGDFITYEIFQSQEALIKWAQKVSKSQVFFIVIKKSDALIDRKKEGYFLVLIERTVKTNHKDKSEQ